MILNIKVIAGAKKDLVKKENDILKVYIHQPAVQGKANKALVEVLSEYFQVKKSQISILKGQHSSRKLVEIK